MKTCYTREQIEAAVKEKGYKWFEDHNNKGYDVNIVGVRNSATGNKVTNKFDDCITVSYKKEGKWKFFCFSCTTDPGDDWVDNPMLEKGVAILKPGQYRGSHKIRLHGGKYTALGQKKDVTVYRDATRDDKYDLNESTTDTGLFGINIHRATALEGKTSTYVDKWSAGCQVIANNDDWKTFMKIMQKAKDVWGNSFSYTLIESKDIS
tara:strand:+ start:6208 stop:6828 length:621 start_codon:yes stop_codon:yes gene_type:complete